MTGKGLAESCLAGVHEVAAAFPEAGIQSPELKAGAVRCLAGAPGVYLLNTLLRTASRILLVLVDGSPIRSEAEIRKLVKRAQIHTLWMDVDQTFAVDASVTNCPGLSQVHLALVVKDGLCDAFRDVTGGKRPDVNRADPDITIFAKAASGKLWLSLDLSGPGLHQRGYRLGAAHEAPMRETLAAGLLRLSGWTSFCQHVAGLVTSMSRAPGEALARKAFEWERDGVEDKSKDSLARRIPLRMQASGLFLNPMCGTGTIGIEAALCLARIYPRRRAKDFGFLELKPFQTQTALWKRLQAEVEALELSPEQLREAYASLDEGRPSAAFGTSDSIFTAVRLSDIDERSVATCESAAKRAGVERLVRIDKEDFHNARCETPGSLVLLNPPYEKRIHSGEGESYRWLGDVLKNGFAGSQVWIFSANLPAMKTVGLRPTRSHKLRSGPLDAVVSQFILYPKAAAQHSPHDS